MGQEGTFTSEYTKTYTTFSGCDIVASFGDRIIGELQAITYSISREKAPVYTFGSAEPRSFSRGKRGIAGTLVFTVFDRDALIEELKKSQLDHRVRRIGAGTNPDRVDETVDRAPVSIDEWDKAMSDDFGDMLGTQSAEEQNQEDQKDMIAPPVDPVYADEVPPFDVTITFANEYGQMASMKIYGVEILNEGVGYSIDAVSTERACSFVARRVDTMQKEPREEEEG